MAGGGSNGKRVAVALAVTLLLALIVPPFVNANRFRARLAKSVAGSIGRPVTMGDVKIRLLPRPGFEIENFAIADDPAFSAEPLLRAETVIARLRLTSLWRGKLEIARLSFAYPSLNLVRNAGGRWNIEGLLRHASQLSTAPTAKKKPEARPRFPYIEADSGRINFKVLQEKKAHVFVDADFALWLESESQWNMRLEARPTRTDANLGDTGTLRVEGSFFRADRLEQTPLKLNIKWDKSQLGQLTTLIYGRDRGWRGNLDISAKLEGTPQEFTITGTAQLNDFRRYDIASDDSFRITAACDAKYSANAAADDVTKNYFDCKLPVGEGAVTLRGFGQHWPQSPDYLSLRATSVPVAALALLLRHGKRNVPADLNGGGTVNAYFSRRTTPSSEAKWIGQGTLVNANLISPSLAQNLQLEGVHFGFSEVELGPGGPTSAGSKSRLEKSKQNLRNPAPNNIFTMDPFTIALGGTKPITLSGTGSHDGFQLQMKGEADLRNLLSTARLLGFRPPAVATQGTASLDLAVSDHWAGFAAPVVTGTAQLRRVKAQMNEVAAPVEIASATLVLTPEEASIQKLTAGMIGTRTQLDGSLTVPRICEENPCPVRFDLHASELNFDDLNRILNPKFRPTNWLSFAQAPASGDHKLFDLALIGKLTANRLIMKTLVATNVSAYIAKVDGAINLTNVQADLLGGKHRGNWRGEFAANAVTYEGRGTIDNASLAQVSALTHDNWATGFMTGEYNLKLSGTDASTLRRSATGTLKFTWKNGTVRSLTAPEFGSPLQFARWSGALRLESGAIQIANSEMDSPSGHYRVSGSANLGRELNLNFLDTKRRVAVTGTLDRPEIKTTSEAASTSTSSSESASNRQNASVPASKARN